MQTSMTTNANTDPDFDGLNAAMQGYFNLAYFNEKSGPLFKVDAGDLYQIYIDNLPTQHQQFHRCSCCRNFLRNYGDLVIVCDDGRTLSPIWPHEHSVPAVYQDAVRAIRRAVEAAAITGVFLSKESIWGNPESGGFTHFWQKNPAPFKDYYRTPGQVMAQKRQDYGTLQHGLADFSRDVVAQAVTLLESDALYRAEKTIGPAKFLLDLHDKVDDIRYRNGCNLIWKAVATAPVGFCTPRSSMIGTLLDDIKSGMGFDAVAARFKAKMHPLQYQRPQAAPAAGNIAQAEKLVREMGIEASLKRRFARLSEIPLLWSPKPAKQPVAGEGVFGHLTPKGAKAPLRPLDMPAQQITWDKFVRTVLPNAEKIEVYMESRMNFCAMVTAVDPDAPPILQWDLEEKRNPFNWYVYSGGSAPARWGLRYMDWVEVTGVALKPFMWTDPEKFSNHGKAAIFFLKGARDTENRTLALFPETLKSHLHPIRATIEAYSQSRNLEGYEESDACGLRLQEKNEPHRIKVTTSIGAAIYHIDRWD